MRNAHTNKEGQAHTWTPTVFAVHYKKTYIVKTISLEVLALPVDVVGEILRAHRFSELNAPLELEWLVLEHRWVRLELDRGFP
jgi:hypothetical protein